ncbi:MAG: STAS domain-containing protein [Candidatus Atribacteria bacterium]|nr:STAS domain-containing protein [Candidatus Atribacteria bacterium]MCD6349438.1 STAS domain-containing protein [Candidatus Atribacteria bacterium]
MKKLIVSKIGELIEVLGQGNEQKEAWRDFLVDFAEVCDNDDLREALKEPVSNLLEVIGEGKLSDGLLFLSNEIEQFPVIEIYRVIVELLEEKRMEAENKIAELREVLSELSTPVIHLWKDVLLAPIIGTLDSQRAQSMSEKVLNAVSETGAKLVIVDVTGVPLIDTIVGEFLIEMFSAVKLLGADVILTGIKPEIAHTLVKLDIDFDMVNIKRDLESALKYAMEGSAAGKSLG